MTLQSEDMGKLVAGPDGWIEWSGGPRPHLPATVVDVRLRDGRSESSIVSAFARWQHIQSGNDIIAFRPAHREAQPETDGGGEDDVRFALGALRAAKATLNGLGVTVGGRVSMVEDAITRLEKRAALASKGV